MSVLDKFLDAVKLNDDYDDDDDFYDDEIEDDYEEEKPKKRFFQKMSSADRDDEDEDNEPAASKKTSSSASRTVKTSSKITPMRSKRTGSSSMEVHVTKPASMEDTREIADTLLAGCTVVLNLEGLDVEVAQRIIDFSCGACYSINGSLQKVSSYIFILTPANVEISGDIQDILSGAFELPPIRTNF